MRKVASADKKQVFFLFERFRALHEFSVANQSCHNLNNPVKLAPFDDRPDY